MDSIATIKTFCSGPTGTNEMLEALKGGSWGGNVNMAKVEVPKETKGWFAPMEGATDVFREIKKEDAICCVCKERVKVSIHPSKK